MLCLWLGLILLRGILLCLWRRLLLLLLLLLVLLLRAVLLCGRQDKAQLLLSVYLLLQLLNHIRRIYRPTRQPVPFNHCCTTRRTWLPSSTLCCRSTHTPCSRTPASLPPVLLFIVIIIIPLCFLL